MSEPAAIEAPPPRAAAFAFIFVTILLDMLAFVIEARTLLPK